MSAIRFRASDHTFLEPNLKRELALFLIKCFGAFCIGLILAPVVIQSGNGLAFMAVASILTAYVLFGKGGAR